MGLRRDGVVIQQRLVLEGAIRLVGNGRSTKRFKVASVLDGRRG